MSVSQGETIIRPAVALLVQSAHTFTDVLQHALEFEDTHVFSEARIVDTLLSDVDVTLRNDAGEDLGVAVMTTVGDALLFGRFSSVFFKIASDKVRFALLLCCAVLCCTCAVHVPCCAAVLCCCDCSDLPLLLRSAVVALCSRVRWHSEMPKDLWMPMWMCMRCGCTCECGCECGECGCAYACGCGCRYACGC